MQKLKEVQRQEEQHLLDSWRETQNNKRITPCRVIQAEKKEECQRFPEGAGLESSVRRKEKRILKKVLRENMTPRMTLGSSTLA